MIHMPWLLSLCSLLVLSASTVACRRASPEQAIARAVKLSNTALSASAKNDAQRVYEQRCQVCHGARGRGDGPSAAALTPRPRDYTDKTWQASVSDESLVRAIIEGGISSGKSQLMPPNRDLAEKPEVVAGLLQIVRRFAAP